MAPLYRQGKRRGWELNLIILTPKSAALSPTPGGFGWHPLREDASLVKPWRSAGQGLWLPVTLASERLSHQLLITQPVLEELLV